MQSVVQLVYQVVIRVAIESHHSQQGGRVLMALGPCPRRGLAPATFVSMIWSREFPTTRRDRTSGRLTPAGQPPSDSMFPLRPRQVSVCPVHLPAAQLSHPRSLFGLTGVSCHG